MSTMWDRERETSERVRRKRERESEGESEHENRSLSGGIGVQRRVLGVCTHRSRTRGNLERDTFRGVVVTNVEI